MALALHGGGPRCLISVACLTSLGLTPSHFKIMAGVSAGSVVASLACFNNMNFETILQKLWQEFSQEAQSTNFQQRLQTFLDDEFEDLGFYQPSKPRVLVATYCYEEQDLVVFDSHENSTISVVTVLSMACAMPIFMKQISYQNQTYGDFGDLDNDPIEWLLPYARPREDQKSALPILSVGTGIPVLGLKPPTDYSSNVEDLKLLMMRRNNQTHRQTYSLVPNCLCINAKIEYRDLYQNAQPDDWLACLKIGDQWAKIYQEQVAQLLGQPLTLQPIEQQIQAREKLRKDIRNIELFAFSVKEHTEKKLSWMFDVFLAEIFQDFQALTMTQPKKRNFENLDPQQFRNFLLYLTEFEGLDFNAYFILKKLLNHKFCEAKEETKIASATN